MEGFDITSTNTNRNNENTVNCLTTPDRINHQDICLDTLESGQVIMDEFDTYSSKGNDRMKIRGYVARLRRILLQFFAVTTFQGLPHVANASEKRSYCRLAYWVAIIFIAIGLMVWAVVSVTSEYVEMNTALQSRQAYKSEIPFPAITICNQNLSRKSVISRIANISEDLMLFLALISGNNVLLDNFDYRTFLNETDEIFGEDSDFYYNKSGHQLENMLLSCRFDGETQQCNFTQQSSTSGNCYTFNSGQDGSIFYTTDAGYWYGLELILTAEEHEYFFDDIDSVGFNVYIHDKDHFPYFGGVGSFLVSTGQLTQVVLNRIDYKLLSPAYGGQCSDDITLKYFNSYSMVSCRTECLTDFIVNSCNCKAQFMPGPARVCKLSDTCMFENIARYDEDHCNCPIGCEFTNYAKTLSYAKYPAGHLTKTLNNSDFLSENSIFPDFVISSTVGKDGSEIFYLNEEFDDAYLRNNLAKLRIYYDDLLVITNEETLDYSLFQFIADFGGHIGLFTGAGFLTLFEIIELCFIRSDVDNSSWS